MKNLNSLFIEHGLYDRSVLEGYSERHIVKLRMSERYAHLGILHYRDDVVFKKGLWNDFNRACRGVIVDFQNKKLLTRPFDKFYNVGEAEAPSLRELERKMGFTVMEKLDGSMILTPYDEVTNTFFASTKGSIDSEQGIWATSRIPESVKDKKLLWKYTLMWEMISKEYQIVIPYDKKGYEEGLYLIGVRENTSEKLFSPSEVHAFAKEYKLKTFKTYEFPSIQSILDNSKELPFSEEGYVIRFHDDDLMVKVKSKEYLRVHRFVSNLSSKNILDVLIAGQENEIYDNLFLVPEEYRDDVEKTMRDFQREALAFRNQCYVYFADAPKDDRKTFALHVNAKVPGEYKGFLFKLFENKDPELPSIYMVFRKR